MSLDKLASEIESMAKAEAKVVSKEAKAGAKSIGSEAKDSVAEYRDAAITQAEKMSDQSAVESIAAARQRNQGRARLNVVGSHVAGRRSRLEGQGGNTRIPSAEGYHRI